MKAKITEEYLFSVINESIQKHLNEIGETPNGQKKLGKLYAYRTKQALDAYDKGDEHKFQDRLKRATNAWRYASDKQDEIDIDNERGDKHEMTKAFNHGEKKGERKRLKEDFSPNKDDLASKTFNWILERWPKKYEVSGEIISSKRTFSAFNKMGYVEMKARNISIKYKGEEVYSITKGTVVFANDIVLFKGKTVSGENVSIKFERPSELTI